MKTLGKQLMQSFLLGAVMPALIIGGMVQRSQENNADVQNVPSTETLAFIQDNADEFLSMTHTSFVPVMDSSGTVRMTELEEYIVNVVLAEMPADFELEALKAQSVVARTYAMRRNTVAQKHPEGAVCRDSTCCQGFVTEADYLAKGGTKQAVNKIRQAVLSTSGQVLEYDGMLIEATYFSCSGGRTEDAAAVWGSEIPYLRAAESPGEEDTVHYTDSVTFTVNQIESALGVSLSGSAEDWFIPLGYTEGNGVAEMEVGSTVFTGVELRRLLNLRSTNFTVETTADAITFTTYGYGHRVGMSQYGADAMALSGSTYNEILAYYYPGTTMTDLRMIDKE